MKKDKFFRSRVCYIIEETFGYLISILITGVYLARLCQSLSFSDSTVAILSSFTSLGCLFQLVSIYLTGRGRYKKKVTFLYTVSQLLFTLLYVLPLFKFSQGVKAIIFIGMLLVGNFLTSAASSPRTVWFMAMVPDEQRGIFTSRKEAISLVCGIIFQFAMGSVADYYGAIGNERALFIVCGVTIFTMMVIHTLSLLLADEKEPEAKEKISLIKGIKEVLCDKRIRPILFVEIMWAVCAMISTPFLGTYQIKELSFSMTFVAVLSVVYAIARIVASIYLAKYADKKSFSKMLVICYILVAVSFGAGVFTVPSNGHILFTVHHIFYAMAMGGINSAGINLIYDIVTPEKRGCTLAVKSVFCGVTGFVATTLATPLINYIQANNNTFLGMRMYAQQVLMLISLIISIILILYTEIVLVKIKKYAK